MKKFSLNKILLSSVLLASIFVPSLFLASCSAASTTQINTPVKISATNNSFLASNFTFTLGPQPVFKKNGANLDNKTDSLFFDYCANIIAPTYAFPSAAGLGRSPPPRAMGCRGLRLGEEWRAAEAGCVSFPPPSPR